MNSQRPPTIDAVAAQRWAASIPPQSPWLHEEVARRMESRLALILRTPARWLHWAPMLGGRAIHAALCQRYPQASCHVFEPTQEQMQAARRAFQVPWWKPSAWGRSSSVQYGMPQERVDMLWANMALHMHADPQALISQWHRALAVDGFLMFSCLGPDTLRELRDLYQALDWPHPSHQFTDMHDWGDMLVHAGFAEPVMDMERITLTFGSVESLVQELRGLGRNLHTGRFNGLRGRAWRKHLDDQIARHLGVPDQPGRYQLTFEIVYGHAFKPPARLTVAPQTSIALDDMKAALADKMRAGNSRRVVSGG